MKLFRLALVVLMFAPAAARAQTTTSAFDSNAAYLAWTAQTQFQTLFGAKMRWGNGAVGGTWETALVNESGARLAKGQQAWGGPVSFRLDYDPFGTTLASLAVGGSQIRSNGVSTGPVNSIVARARAYDPALGSGFDWFRITLRATQEVVFDSRPGGGLLIGDRNGEFVTLQDVRFENGFSIEGAVVLNQAATEKRAVPLAHFQIGSTVAPEPGTLLMLGTGLMGLGVAVRRRKLAELDGLEL